MKNKIFDFCETKLIKMIMFFSIIILVYIKFNITKINLFEQILTDTITVVSIFIGILMSLMGFLLSVSGREVVKKIICLGAGKLILKEFVFPIFAGLTIVILSIFIKAISKTPNNLIDIISILWAIFCIYFFLAFTRVIILMYMILHRVFLELATECPNSDEDHNVNAQRIQNYSDEKLPPIYPDER